MPADTVFMDKLTALCKRRGFIFQSSEIYGGIGGFRDYGPLGVELKRNIKEAWWRDFVMNPPLGPDGREIQMVGLDCSIIMNPKVWEASGHATGFVDPMVDCGACKRRFRADKVLLFTVLPKESVTNRVGVESSRENPIVSCDRSKAVTFSLESDFGGLKGFVEAAATAFGKANNIGYLKYFRVPLGRSTNFDSGTYVPGFDSRKDDAQAAALQIICNEVTR